MRTRGEYKTPGGKLIAVELSVRDGALRDVVVTGDFFLYPEEALPILASSLEGASASLGSPEFAALVAAAIPPDVELLGASPEALATAVMRSLESLSVVNGTRA